MARKDIIERLRKIIRENTYPLDYKAETDAYNCYSYALNLGADPEAIELCVYNLGGISLTIYPPHSSQEAEQALKEDMKVLGIECRKSSYEEKLLPDEFKIVLFYADCFEDSTDFHIIRQDDDGTWSYKESINGGISGFVGNPKYFNTVLDFVGFYILKVT